MALQIHLFGTPYCLQEGQPLSIQRRKALALLAYLAVTSQPHSRDTLATLFWPEHDQTGARANLRRDLSYLKKELGNDILDITRTDVGLTGQGAWQLDTAVFTSYLTQLRTHDHVNIQLCPACQTALVEAVTLYKGDFMDGFSLPDCPAFDEWQFFQREGLRQALANVLQQLINWYVGQGTYEQAIVHGRRWLTLDSLHEPAHRCLMQLYAWNDQHAAALRQYEECQRLLDEELGVAPEEETAELYHVIKARQLPAPQPTAESPPLVTPEPHLRYSQDELLAIGGHGELYLGLDHLTGSSIVIKRLRPELIKESAEYITRFQREGEALRQLDHPNIVKMLDTFAEAGQYCIVMEYVPGGSLRTRLDQEIVLPTEQVIALGLELADALGRAHHLGIIHRDLKPENVLLAADGTPRLTDFGVARLQEDDVRVTRTGSILGSPAYMSPEALRGEELDARSDIWSLGILLYEMLTGERPFKGEQITAIMLSILTEEVPEITRLQPEVPQALADLLQRMLSKEREERIGSARQVAAALEVIQQGKPDNATYNAWRSATPTPAVSPPPSTPQRQEPEDDTKTTSSSIPTRINIPVPYDALVGRAAELADIRRFLSGSSTIRLLTLVGPGGIGKTRLALAAAEQLQSSFAHGVCFVSLVSLQTAEYIIPTLAEAFGLRLGSSGNPEMQIMRYLQDKQLLLLLDNFEHVLEEAGLVAQILAAAPQVRILVTSRERLNLSGETVYAVSGLDFPAVATGEMTPFGPSVADYDAVKLLVRHAQRVCPGFELNTADYRYVARICRMVGGMPLALVLAAGWLELLSPAEIAEELERSFDILESELRDLPERHRSMRTVFEGSWQRLTAKAQQVFARLSVFRGNFVREAAQAVADADLPTLRWLVNQSLVAVSEAGHYELHELLRQFGEAKLIAASEMNAIRDKHFAFYLALTEEVAPHLAHGEASVWVNRLEKEHDNLRAALNWSLAQESAVEMADGLRLASLLEQFWDFGGHYQEALGWLSRFLAVTETVVPETITARGHAFMYARRFAGMLGDYNGARRYAEQALLQFQRVEDISGGARALADLAFLDMKQDAYASARERLEEALEMARESGDVTAERRAFGVWGSICWRQGLYDAAERHWKRGLTLARQQDNKDIIKVFLYYLGNTALYQGDLVTAQALHLKALEMSHEVGDLAHICWSNVALGDIAFIRGNNEQARTFYHDHLQTLRELGSQEGLGMALLGAGRVATRAADFTAAHTYLVEALQIQQEMHSTFHKVAVLEGLAELALAQAAVTDEPTAVDFYQRAAQLYGAAEALRTAVGTPLPPVWRSLYEQNQRLIQQALGEALTTAAKEVAGVTDLAEIIEIAKHPTAYLPVEATLTATARHNLPLESTVFIGRAQELEELCPLLENSDTRLVTVVGLGGIGKTRLALAAAARQRQLFNDGVFFVPLAPLQAAEHLVSALADALGFHFSGQGDPRTQLLRHLHAKQMLLVLDNFEHVLEGAPLVAEILATAPKVRVLATSRERLNLTGERLFVLGGLAFPKRWGENTTTVVEYDAVKLFMEHAQRMRPNFAPDTTAYDHIAHIARLASGMPLALVLAASWLELLTPPEIAAEIEQTLDFLEGAFRDLPERHRSIRAVFAGSWQRLTPEAQICFARLSIFRGGFTREAAQQVAGADLRTLRLLLHKSLLTLNKDGRYEIHELLRQYAAEQLPPAEAPGLGEKYGRFYGTLLSRCYPLLQQEPYQQISQEINTEMDNVRHAWSLALELAQAFPEQAAQIIAQFTPTLYLYYYINGPLQVGRQTFWQAMQALQTAGWQDNTVQQDTGRCHLTLLQVQVRLAFFSLGLGDYETVDQLLTTVLPALRQLGQTDELALALCVWGKTNLLRGQRPLAQTQFEESLALFRQIGDRYHEADVLKVLGVVAVDRGQHDETMHYYNQSLTIFRQLGFVPGMTSLLHNMGTAYFRQHDYERARQSYEGALSLAQAVGYDRIVMESTGAMGGIYRELGQYKQAEAYFKRSVAMARDLGEQRLLAVNLKGLGMVYLDMNELSAVPQYLGEGLAVAEATQNVPDSLSCISIFAHLWARQGQVENALRALWFVAQQRAARLADKERNQQLLDELKVELPTAVVEKAQAWAATQTLAEMIQFTHALAEV